MHRVTLCCVVSRDVRCRVAESRQQSAGIMRNPRFAASRVPNEYGFRVVVDG